MAKRLTKYHQQHVKDKIKAIELVLRLQKHALSPEPIMTRDQVDAAKYLLSLIVSKAAIEINSTGNVNVQLIRFDDNYDQVGFINSTADDISNQPALSAVEIDDDGEDQGEDDE